MDFKIRIADINIGIHSLHSNIYNVCKDYLINDKEISDIEIITDDDKIIMESERALQYYADLPGVGSLENMLVHRTIAEELPTYNAFLMHGAVIAVDNYSYMFVARSGTGKTTHIKKWLYNIKNSFVVNGDKPIVLINDCGTFACGTPWCGKERYGTNISLPLRSIVFMERNEKNSIEQVSFKQILPLLLEQVYHPHNAEQMRKTINLLKHLKNDVSFYKFYFNNFAEDAFNVSYDALVNNKC